MADETLRYLLVTHIPFARNGQGDVVLDSLWARDLEGIAQSGWRVRVCAPELSSESAVRTWGPSAATLPKNGPVEFTGFPPIQRRVDFWKWLKIRSVLRREIVAADLVHTSNVFAPYVGLSYAHDFAVKLGTKTVYVIAEDFNDMLEWEWVRVGDSPRQIARRQRHVDTLERRSRLSASTASLTFLHTPAAVLRYRLWARNGLAIRQPGHETGDVIAALDFEEKCRAITEGERLVIVGACRHKPLKGLDLLIRAIELLARRGIAVEARLFGSGEQQESLKALAARLDVADRVLFPGSLPPGRDVYRAISEGHIFAMPHRTTDFGRGFFDALAGGTPVLAFRTPASLETVRDGIDGVLASLDDVESLASAIQRFHEDRPLLVRCSQAARQRALCNTRSEWYRLRAEWTRSLFAEESKGV